MYAFISYIGYQTSKIEINFPYDEYKVKNIRLKPHVISSEDIWITARSREFMGRTETQLVRFLFLLDIFQLCQIWGR